MIIGPCVGSATQGALLNLFEPEYQAVLDRATVLGYTLPGALVQTEQNRFLKALKDSGAWAKADCIQFYRSDVVESSAFGSICWKNPAATGAALVNSPVAVNNRGYRLDGISSYINTNFTPSGTGNYKLNDAGVLVMPFQLTSQSIFGITNTFWLRAVIESVTNNRINAEGNSLNTAYSYGTQIELKSIHRTSSTNVKLGKGKVLTDRTQTSASIATEPILLGRSSLVHGANGFSFFIAGANMVDYIDAIVDAYNVYVANTL